MADDIGLVAASERPSERLPTSRLLHIALDWLGLSSIPAGLVWIKTGRLESWLPGLEAAAWMV